MLKSLERKTVAVHIVLCARACVCVRLCGTMKRCELLINVMNLRHNQTAAAAAGASSNGTHFIILSVLSILYNVCQRHLRHFYPKKKFRLTMCFIYKHTIQTTHTHTHTCRRKHTRVRVEVTFVWFKSFLSNMINQSQQLGCSSGYRPKWCNNTHHGMGNDSTLLKYQQLNNPFNAFSLWSLLIVFSIFRYAYTVNIYLFGLVFFLHSRIVFRVNIPDSAKRI